MLIDEAHDIRPEVLGILRILTNFDTAPIALPRLHLSVTSILQRVVPRGVQRNTCGQSQRDTRLPVKEIRLARMHTAAASGQAPAQSQHAVVGRGIGMLCTQESHGTRLAASIVPRQDYCVMCKDQMTLSKEIMEYYDSTSIREPRKDLRLAVIWLMAPGLLLALVILPSIVTYASGISGILHDVNTPLRRHCVIIMPLGLFYILKPL